MTDLVLSDVHLDLTGACRGLAHVTTFGLLDATPRVMNAAQSGGLDEDGDLIVSRRAHEASPTQKQLSIAHHGATALADVGMQVWRGECLLVDWLMEAAARGELSGVRTILELGGGTGMATVVAAHALASSSTPAAGNDTDSHAPTGLLCVHNGGHPARIFCTDHHLPSLETARQNLASNMHLCCRPDGGREQQPPGMPSSCPVAEIGPSLAKLGLECHFRQMDWMDFAAYSASSVTSVSEMEAGGSGRGGSPRSRAVQFVEALIQDEGDRLVSDIMPMAFGTSGGLPVGSTRGDFFKWCPHDMQCLQELDLIIAVSACKAAVRDS